MADYWGLSRAIPDPVATFLEAWQVLISRSTERWPSPARGELEEKIPIGGSAFAAAGQVHGRVSQLLLQTRSVESALRTLATWHAKDHPPLDQDLQDQSAY